MIRISAIARLSPVEVLQGEVREFDLTFRTIKQARPLEECERVGAGSFVTANIVSDTSELESFLQVPLDQLMSHCREIAGRHNVAEVINFAVTSYLRNSVYIWTKIQVY